MPEHPTNEARVEGNLACTMPCKEKEDESQIEALYRVMYEAMMAKDTVTLNRIHADDFVLILQEELVKAGVLPANFNFEAHKELVPMQPDDVVKDQISAKVEDGILTITMPKTEPKEKVTKAIEVS